MLKGDETLRYVIKNYNEEQSERQVQKDDEVDKRGSRRH